MLRNRAFLALTAFALAGGRGQGQTASVTFFPADRAAGVNPDTHLSLTFSSPPMLGTSGRIRIYDAADGRLVDTLDLSVPAGPHPSKRITVAAAAGPMLDPSIPTSPTTTTPAVRTTPADLHQYQLTTIGGLPDFHFYPVIIHGNVATIYLHNGVLRYHHTYQVRIDPGVFSAELRWSFSTKSAPPRANSDRVVVAADGSGDFSTVQGAIDIVPDHPARRVTIFIRNGTYEEIVFFRNKANLTIRGEDRDLVQVGYANNSGFNPPQPGPNRRCAFSAYESTGIELVNFSANNYAFGQAEALLISGSENIVSHMNISGSGDALNLRGSVYIADSAITGDGDTILGVGPAFFLRCQIQSAGPFMWIRNTEANHGNVFVDCIFTALARRMRGTRPENAAPLPATPSTVLARLPNNHGLNYPYAEAVLINCKLSGIPAGGWGPIEDETSHLHLWEFHSTDADGRPIDTAGRHPASRQLTEDRDSKTIASYQDPAFVLGGWTPVLHP